MSENSAVFVREELMRAKLHLGEVQIDLADYATTGLRGVVVGPSGIGKTSACLLIAEQLSDQGWVSVLIDPEGELEQLYGKAVANVEELERALTVRDKSIIVVSAKDASEFIPYGRAILEIADTLRKPICVVMDEGQIFSSASKRANDAGEASDIVNGFVERGRKRRLDLLMTAHRFSSSLHRAVFTSKNLTFIGQAQDPAGWSTLAPTFRASKIDYSAVAALAPGEFFCLSRRGLDRVQLPMAKALAAVAPKASVVKSTLPTTFSQWDRAMRQIPTERLQKLTGPVVALLGSVVGLSGQQMLSGSRALHDELEVRA